MCLIFTHFLHVLNSGFVYKVVNCGSDVFDLSSVSFSSKVCETGVKHAFVINGIRCISYLVKIIKHQHKNMHREKCIHDKYWKGKDKHSNHGKVCECTITNKNNSNNR